MAAGDTKPQKGRRGYEDAARGYADAGDARATQMGATTRDAKYASTHTPSTRR